MQTSFYGIEVYMFIRIHSLFNANVRIFRFSYYFMKFIQTNRFKDPFKITWNELKTSTLRSLFEQVYYVTII